MIRAKTALLLGMTLWAAGGAGSSVRACSTPVFQYAMQRWEPDFYRAYVFHRGRIDKAGTNVVDAMRALAENEERPLNLGVAMFDVAGDLGAEASAVYSNAAPAKLPAVVLAYPYVSQIEAVAWKGDLTMATVGALAESPVRIRMQKLLIEGAATVWIFLDSRDGKASDLAFAGLGDTLKEVTELVNELVHADQEPGPPVVTPDGRVIEVTPAAFSFALLRVARDDPGEEVLVSVLLNSEPGLAGIDEPMVFPVFGRGRALCAFVGSGINITNVLAAAEFMGGPCSCQVKAMNPGFDLPVSAMWEDFMDHMSDDPAEEQPELTRMVSDAPVVDGRTSVTDVVVAPVTSEGDEGQPGIVGAVLLVLAGLVVVVAVGTTMFVLRAGRSGDG